MTIISAAVVFLTSLLALPISYLLNIVSQHKNEGIILATGLGALLLIFVIPWVVLSKKLQQKVNSYFYFLSLLTYSSVISLIIALGNDGLIAEFLGAYLREGEPYMKTAHGTMISYWDGIAHYAMYLTMLAALSWNQSFHDVGLYWAGSYSYGKLVLVLAAIIGKEDPKWTILLHAPYIVICIYVCFSFIENKKDELVHNHMAEDQANCNRHASLWKRPLDLFYFCYLIFATILTIIKFSGAMHGSLPLVSQYRNTIEPYLTDPSLYPRAQLMVQAFYFIPYYAINMYALLHPGQSWLLPLTIMFAGATAQAQFSMIGASFHYRTPYTYRVPQTILARCLFWTINSLLLVMPQIAAQRTLNHHALYLLPVSPSTEKLKASPNRGSVSGISDALNGHQEGISHVAARRESLYNNHGHRLKKIE